MFGKRRATAADARLRLQVPLTRRRTARLTSLPGMGRGVCSPAECRQDYARAVSAPINRVVDDAPLLVLILDF
jgi:hypothetical protein